MKYSVKKLSNNYDIREFDLLFFCKEIDSKYILEIGNKKYLINYDYDIIDFTSDGVLCINLSDKIVIISLSDGSLSFYSGLYDSFVGIESLDTYFLIITDTTIFKINKFNLFVYEFNSFADVIMDYEILDSKKEIKIKFVEEEMRDNLIFKL